MHGTSPLARRPALHTLQATALSETYFHVVEEGGKVLRGCQPEYPPVRRACECVHENGKPTKGIGHASSRWFGFGQRA